MHKEKTVCENILEKLQKRSFAKITMEDYALLIKELLNISNSKSLNGDIIPQDCLDLRD